MELRGERLFISVRDAYSVTRFGLLTGDEEAADWGFMLEAKVDQADDDIHPSCNVFEIPFSHKSIDTIQKAIQYSAEDEQELEELVRRAQGLEPNPDIKIEELDREIAREQARRRRRAVTLAPNVIRLSSKKR